jgi:glycosyltransferase involved in cell wall biosynthesis
MKSRITIQFNNRLQQPASLPDELVISFGEMVSMIKNRSLLKHFLRYREARFCMHSYHSVPWPLMVAILLRLMSLGGCYFQDDQGHKVHVTIVRLIHLLVRAIADFLSKGPMVRDIEQEVRDLASKPRVSAEAIHWERPSIYLRTDLWFGVTAGGSVGHIAGVLNQLDQFTASTKLYSTDVIPTVREDIEKQIIGPHSRFRDFRELSTLYFNRTFYEGVVQDVGEKKLLSFIYQRYSMNNYSGVKLARHYKVPFILEYNGSEIWINKHWGGKSLKYESLAMNIELLNLHAADVIVVVSKPMRDELVQRGIEEIKILVNPNGVDPDKYSPDIDGTPIRQKYSLEGKMVIGFIGTFGKWHGAEVLAEAFGRLLQSKEYRENLRLLMIGDGVTMKMVRDIIARYRIDEECILTGIVPQREGPMYMATCDILVSPHVPNADGTPFFGSPTKLFEYMAMGKAIVASDLDQIGEVLAHERTAWLVKPGDVDALAEAMAKLSAEPEFRALLGTAARAEVNANYTWSQHTERIMEKLQEVIKESHL